SQKCPSRGWARSFKPRAESEKKQHYGGQQVAWPEAITALPLGVARVGQQMDNRCSNSQDGKATIAATQPRQTQYRQHSHPCKDENGFAGTQQEPEQASSDRRFKAVQSFAVCEFRIAEVERIAEQMIVPR